MNEQEIKEQLCDVCHKMWQLGWGAANDGNVSVKLEDGTFFATPTGMSKSFITPDKLVRINDKIAELELQVEPLRAQAETAKKYLPTCYRKSKCTSAAIGNVPMWELCCMHTRLWQPVMPLPTRHWTSTL